MHGDFPPRIGARTALGGAGAAGRLGAQSSAGVAELVDAPDLGSGAYGVGVRVPSPAPLKGKLIYYYNRLTTFTILLTAP